MNQRHSAILDYLSRHDAASVQELAGMHGVSVVTIRQDLNTLEKDGFIRRTHGGATLLDTDNIARRLSIRYEQKLAVARKAASLVEDNETVLIESGSVNALLARELAGRRVQIIAANVFVAQQIRTGDAARVVILGGIYQPESESVVGPLARQGIEATFFSKAFLGMDGFTPEAGFTNSDMMRAEIGSTVVKRCADTFIVGDSTKFNRTSMNRVCGLDDLAGVITNADLPEEQRARLDAGRARLHLA